MADLTVLSSSPSPIYAHPSISTPHFPSATSPYPRSSTLPFASPRFSSRSVANLAQYQRPYTPSSGSASNLRLDTTTTEERRKSISGPSPTTSPSTSPSLEEQESKLMRRRTIHTSPISSSPPTAGQSSPVNGRPHSPSRSQDSSDHTSQSPTSYLTPPQDFRRSQRPRTRHSRKRSMSAPPTPSIIQIPEDNDDDNNVLYNDQFGTLWKRRPTKRTVDAHGGLGLGHTGMGVYAAGDTREINPPPPPLLRPTTFWRHTPRSGVSGASYSPSSHLVRRSTFIAAGLTYDRPGHDLSALCVESRLGKARVVVKPGEQLMISIPSH